ncbi:unnamed protein product, partial [Thelazia callipaeda]|uniref:Amino_oxidase domain-containing protein n=1 Tax=Thelazia callipaeda TaxID=103827 RepID=A0A0N5DC25_THECL
ELTPGGLSRTITDKNGFLWDLGGHIIFNHNLPYYDEAVRWAVHEWNTFKRNCQIDISYMYNEKSLHLVPYPAQYAIPLFPAHIKKNCLEDFKVCCENEKKINLIKNFDQWIATNFGETLNKYFFTPYTKKVWTVEPIEMNSIWVASRVAKLPHEKLEELCTLTAENLKNVDLGWGPNAQFMFPRNGGTGAIWKAMVTNIDAINKKIIYENRKFELFEISYDVLINTSPIDQLIENTKLCRSLDLKHNKVIIVGIGLKKPISMIAKQYTWLYFPDESIPFYRLTFISQYGIMTPDNRNFWSILCESAQPSDSKITEEEIMQRTINCLILKSIISYEQIVSKFSMVLPYGYPIPTVNRDTELARAHQALEKHQIYSRGRFGGWKYEASNQDHCFVQGKEIVDRILLGQPETIYKNGLSMSHG